MFLVSDDMEVTVSWHQTDGGYWPGREAFIQGEL